MTPTSSSSRSSTFVSYIRNERSLAVPHPIDSWRTSSLVVQFQNKQFSPKSNPCSISFFRRPTFSTARLSYSANPEAYFAPQAALPRCDTVPDLTLKAFPGSAFRHPSRATAEMRFSRVWLRHYGCSEVLAQWQGPLSLLIPQPDPVNNLAQRIEGVERRICSGELLQVAYCVFFNTQEQPLNVQISLTDARLKQKGRNEISRTAELHAAGTRNADVPNGHYSIPDWTSLVVTLPDLLRDGRAEELATRKPNDLLTLARNTVRAGDKAAISNVSANMYMSAMYLLCLCDTSGIEDPFTMDQAKSFFKRWHSASDSDGSDAAMTNSERKKFRETTNTVASLRALQVGFEALFLETPLLAFERFPLSSQRWARPNMLHAAQARIARSAKPTTLQTLETSVYGGIFDLAFSGSASCSAILARVAEVIHEIEFDNTTILAPHWFNPDRNNLLNQDVPSVELSDVSFSGAAGSGDPDVGEGVDAGDQPQRQRSISSEDAEERPVKRRRIHSPSPPPEVDPLSQYSSLIHIPSQIKQMKARMTTPKALCHPCTLTSVILVTNTREYTNSIWTL
ncbi:hypothetical protein NMY22_g16925 [Coprinellus aureogranulatus]|nr:hypothetical protein NMY22_g16925 [Coprinellus aureogranulatus]